MSDPRDHTLHRGGRRRPLTGALLALSMLAALVVIPAASPHDEAAALPAGFTSSTVFTGLNLPTQMAFSPDGRVFVAEKNGYIKVFPSVTSTSGTVFKNLSERVFNNWDRGLLGIAVDPRTGDGTGHDFVYVLYAKDGNLLPGGSVPRWNDSCPTPPGGEKDGCVVMGTLSRIPILPNGTGGNEQILIDNEWCQQFTSHSVGALHFGPDGHLYVTGGEGASWANADWGQFGGKEPGTPTPVNPCGDPPGAVGQGNTSPNGRGGAMRSQSPRRPAGEPRLLSGSLLRLDPDTGNGVPGNPMFNPAAPSANESRILAYGMRNPFRFTTRPGTGEVWVGDVGQSTWEEINRVPASPGRAPNFGWPCLEGPDERGGYSSLNMCDALYDDPVDPATAPWYRYEHGTALNANDTCGNEYGSSISGLAFYEGNRYPASYDGSLFVADSSRSCIWVMSKGAGGLPDPSTARTFLNTAGTSIPVDLQIDPFSGDLFYVSIGVPNASGGIQTNTGSVIRIGHSGGGTNTAPNAVATANPTSGNAPLTVNFDGRGSSDPDGDALSYSWDLDGNGVFGDATGPTATRTYANGGNVDVKLKVTDTGGLSHTSPAVRVTVTGGPVNTSPPTIDDTTPAMNQKLTAGPGGWSPSSGNTYAYQWQRCTSEATSSCSDIAGATTNVHHVQEDDGGKRLRVRVTATDSMGRSSSAHSTVTAAATGTNQPPKPVITSPATTTSWKSGDRITFTGSATDAEDGTVPANRFTWRMVTGHCPDECHEHELHNASGVSTGTFFAEDHLAPSYIEITLTVTDAAGRSASTSRRIDPIQVHLTAKTSPAGLRAGMGDTAGTNPITQHWVAGSTVQLTAPLQQTSGGYTWYFTGWSHGGDPTQLVTAPTKDTTYVANYARGPLPFGNLESVSNPAPGRITWSGWAVDKDAPTTPIEVHVYVGGTAETRGASRHVVLANRSHSGLAELHPEFGANHGFAAQIDTSRKGNQKVCAYAVDAAGSGQTLLGCRTVGVVNPNPDGRVDHVSSPSSGRLRVRGWVFDRSSPTAPVRIQVVVGGPRGTRGAEVFNLVADRRRDDVAAAYPGTGNRHGYDSTIATSKSGRQNVCIYAQNVGVGSDTLLGCRTTDIVK